MASRARLARAADAVFERSQLLHPNWSAGMHASRGDADLGAKPELATIGKLGRGVVEDDGGVDLGQEALGGRVIIRDDGIGVMRAVGLDMRQGGIKAVDDPGRD